MNLDSVLKATVGSRLTGYEATAWTVHQILSENNAILNLTVHGSTAYIGTATGVLLAFGLEPAE